MKTKKHAKKVKWKIQKYLNKQTFATIYFFQTFYKQNKQTNETNYFQT